MAKTDGLEIRINGTLRDEPARVLRELKRRGLCRSNMDGISQGLLTLYEKTLNRDAQASRLETLKEAGR